MPIKPDPGSTGCRADIRVPHAAARARFAPAPAAGGGRRQF